ncbi:hypothetical protein DOM21_07190 [Bacteriovorax stolpii]|uniref:replication-relaxation family protein n=1 Tax=Bacteriovorax stolpii TaxID=960 RepID=UPI0011598ECF|nr:replication-relaxation family protein [Bacteriovorax stolpii]QDK41244.1 hypothetical protein DOM21_07190 [Bacteriovorax stolpii]
MRIQERDLKLLKMTCEFGLLSTRQLRDHFFKGVAITTVLKRLRILEKEKLIKRVPGLESTELLWSIDHKGAKMIEKDNYKISWNKHVLEHDHKVSCLRLTFLNHKLYESWVPEHEMKSLLFKKYSYKQSINKLIPDGLMTIRRDGKLETWAMEVELSLKGKKRYDKIFSEYGRKENLTGIWYFIKGDNIFNFLKGLLRHKAALLNGKALMISFVEDVISNHMIAKIYNSKTANNFVDFFGLSNYQLAQVPAHSVSNFVSQKRNFQKDLSYQYHTSISEFQN